MNLDTISDSKRSELDYFPLNCLWRPHERLVLDEFVDQTSTLSGRHYFFSKWIYLFIIKMNLVPD